MRKIKLQVQQNDDATVAFKIADSMNAFQKWSAPSLKRSGYKFLTSLGGFVIAKTSFFFFFVQFSMLSSQLLSVILSFFFFC